VTDAIDRVLAALNARDLRVGWRTVVGDFGVQEETVTGRGEPERHVAVYLIADGGLIARERLIG
jgi:hypothetical protein